MKKLLSIFSISAILGSGTILSGGGIACGSSAKTFNLSDVKLGKDIAGIANKTRTEDEAASITINGKKTYTNVVKDIIDQYKKVFTTSKLTADNFALNSNKITTEKTWAVEITNGDVKVTNDTASDLKVWFNQGLASKTNSLSVVITTSDPNVITKTNDANTKTVTVPLYFAKYIFTTQDANNGDAINIPNTTDTLAQMGLDKSKILDLSQYFTASITSKVIADVKTKWDALEDDEITIYNKVVDSVNANFDTYIKKEGSITKVQDFSTTNPVGDDNKISFSSLIIFYVDHASTTAKISIPSASTLQFGTNKDVFIAIPVYSWRYLTNYFSNHDTYVYAFIGTTPNQ